MAGGAAAGAMVAVRADEQAGAGVVADSVPAHEYEECLAKAAAVLAAIEASADV